MKKIKALLLSLLSLSVLGGASACELPDSLSSLIGGGSSESSSDASTDSSNDSQDTTSETPSTPDGGETPDDNTITEAATLAAWFSQARESGKVPVDYTPVKYVKKPAGARPGMVVYTTYETAWVTPDGELAKKLRVK